MLLKNNLKDDQLAEVKNFSLLHGIWKVGNGYWRSAEKKHAIMLLLAIIGLTAADVYLQVWLNKWRNIFFNTLQDRDIAAFFDSIFLWGTLTVSALVVTVYQRYLQKILELKWRTWLSGWLVEEYLQSKKYYCLQILDKSVDNPDQIISEDAKLFIESILKIFIWFLYTVGILCSFTMILWNLSGAFSLFWHDWHVTIPGDLVWIVFGYAIVVNCIVRKVGHPLVWLNFEQQRYEADFRFLLVRLREYAEVIALYGGEQREGHILHGCFKKIYDNFHQCINRQKVLDGLIFFLYRGAEPLPYIIAVPRFFSGQIQLGGLMQITAAFDKVHKSLTFFVGWYKEIAELEAIVRRLVLFMEAIEQLSVVHQKKSIQVVTVLDPIFSVEGLNLRLPNGALLVHNFAMKLQAGESLLILGASGYGKSMLIKAIAGIWPFGEGCIKIPQNQQCLFLPQNPYLPIGTLREVLLYPQPSLGYSDETLHAVLKKCKLDGLLGRLDAQEDWSHLLSMGEQQRIAFARAILQKPQWLFLDETTSGLDEATEKMLYKLLRSELRETGIISVGHRSSIMPYHDKILTIKEKGGWALVA
ncbi:ABC transporter ATP-binding protein/permease [Pelosinus sp. sgz500959]|uniref:ABC transporter ATP-binding protein/permease n=1 Tax=Pelosinus sp. sgz500959 TaxID=3242472 RepID=UPI00366CEBFB